MTKAPKSTRVDRWVGYEDKNPHVVTALENTSKHFDDSDDLSVHLLEGVYGQESSFGRWVTINGNHVLI